MRRCSLRCAATLALLLVAWRAFVLVVGRGVLWGDARELARTDEVRKAYLGAG